ncbi:hypothetical protein [Pelagicoccus sp. SDUM812002]|uniref:hypothetical protein n=1 Tax=Pelagicoccus sp. SDUM812002 TaxID=3041266 RepID=UPI00280E63FC|nr:hypothetical protein [Pelagicoccus sp. SDUM812002]MDQ8184058.1 hypothetical protein [Pelagicoccus sp. SDUM812002]
MSHLTSNKARLGAIKGVLFMRIQELTTPAALSRNAIVAVASFLLLMLLRLDVDNAASRYQGLVAGLFVLKFLPIFCLTKGGETLRSELKEGTIEYLWVRPASKVELYLGFMLSGFLGTFSIVGSALVGISLAGLALGALGGGAFLSLWLTVVVVVASFTAISGAISSFSSKFVVLGIFYYSFVELGLGAIPNGVQRLAVSFHAKTLLNGLTSGDGNLELNSFAWILATGLIGIVLGAAIFSQSRYVVGSEKEA